MIMLHAMDWSHSVDPVINGAALAITKAMLRVAPRAPAIENPRLMIALIAVIDAQKMNGTVIRNPLM